MSAQLAWAGALIAIDYISLENPQFAEINFYFKAATALVGFITSDKRQASTYSNLLFRAADAVVFANVAYADGAGIGNELGSKGADLINTQFSAQTGGNFTTDKVHAVLSTVVLSASAKIAGNTDFVTKLGYAAFSWATSMLGTALETRNEEPMKLKVQ